MKYGAGGEMMQPILPYRGSPTRDDYKSFEFAETLTDVKHMLEKMNSVFDKVQNQRTFRTDEALTQTPAYQEMIDMKLRLLQMIDKVNKVADGGPRNGNMHDPVLPVPGHDHISLLETRAQEESIKRQYPRQLVTLCRH